MSILYERLTRKMTKENLWLYVLSLLKQSPMYGYEIRKEVKKRFGFEPNEVTAYAVLLKLRMGGYVAIKEVLPSPEGPKRKYYVVSPKGEEELNKTQTFLKEMLTKIFKVVNALPQLEKDQLKRPKTAL